MQNGKGPLEAGSMCTHHMSMSNRLMVGVKC